MDKLGIPEPSIRLDGFPTCARGDGREVETAGGLCAMDGGKGASLEMLRRTCHRQIRSALRQMILCGDCAAVSLAEIRCAKCTWCRGAIMGIAGVGEQVWGGAEFEPYLKGIATFEPGWQKKAFV